MRVRFDVDRFDWLEINTEVELLNFPEDSSAYLTQNEVKVRFLVQNSLRKEYFADDFKAVVDYSMASPADSLAPVMVIFHPENVLDVVTDPDTLIVTYKNP